MRFKVLHVRPHIWLFKQQETPSSNANTDDSSSTDGPLVYKRSTSLKLIKSHALAEGEKGNISSVIEKPVTLGAALSGKHDQRQGKNAQVCTVVDAGCTCRATVTSQAKHKRAEVSSHGNATDVGSLHDVCRPRRPQAVTTKVEKTDRSAAKQTHIHANIPAKLSRLPGRNANVVTRLVCKSSHDVIKDVQDYTEENNVLGISNPDKGPLVNTTSKQGGDVDASLMPSHVHDLECRLRSAGLEEQRKSTQKKNSLSSEDIFMTSSEVSSGIDTSAHAETLHTTTMSEMQAMLLKPNAAFDIEVPILSDRVMSLDDLRASIAQRKLATLSPPQASLHADNARLANEGNGDSISRSPPTVSPENIHSMNAISPHHNHLIPNEKLEVRVKHVDVGATRRRRSSGSDVVSQVQAKQCQRSGSSTPSKVNSLCKDDRPTLRRSAHRLELGPHKDKEPVLHGLPQLRSQKGPVQEQRRSFNSTWKKGSHEIHSVVGGRNALALEECFLCHPESEDGQEQQVVSSSSCEIQVLSDCTQDNPSDSSRGYPLLKVHLGGMSLAKPSGGDLGAYISKEGELRHELVPSDSAVAMVKSSYDPGRDFKESMMEMVAAKRLHTPPQLQQLLQCYLSLNPPRYHPIIIKVLHELCSELFQ